MECPPPQNAIRICIVLFEEDCINIRIVQFGLKPELTWLTQKFLPEPGLTGGVKIFDRCVFAEFYQDFLWPASEC